MPAAELKQSIYSLAPDLPPRLLDSFFSGMDEDYFNSFSPSEIARHLRMAAVLSPETAVQLHIAPQQDGTFELLLVAFDYSGQFSIFCGLISAFALNIRTGNIYSFTTRSRGAKV